MLANHTHERLAALGLPGMAKALDDQQRQPDTAALTFEVRLGLMIDREVTERDNKRLIARLKFAALRQAAIIEDIDLRTPRGIDRAFFAKLVDGDWIARKQNLLITGPTGVGKSWIACALGHKACRDNRSVLYHRMPRLFEALALARGDGRHARLLKGLARVELLILDDWGLAPLTGDQRRDLLEIVDDRHQRGSTIIERSLPKPQTLTPPPNPDPNHLAGNGAWSPSSGWPPSVGTRGRVQSDCLAAIVGIRSARCRRLRRSAAPFGDGERRFHSMVSARFI